MAFGQSSAGWKATLTRLMSRRDAIKRVLPAATKTERAKQRRKIGPLGGQLVKGNTLKRYNESYDEVCQFLAMHRGFTVHDWNEFDQKMSSYVECLWEQGRSKSDASYALAAVQYFKPEAKGKIPYSWRLLKAWNKLELPLRAYPMTAQMALAFAQRMIQVGQARCGWLTLVGFSCFLRTGELLGLTRQSVVFNLGSQKAVLYLLGPKGSHHSLHSAEKVVVTETVALQALKSLCQRKSKDELLSDVSPQQFRKVWHDCVAFFKLTELHVMPYAMRRGGATSAYKNGATFEELLLKGRWKNLSTARIYLDEAVMELGQLSLSSLSQRLLTALSHEFAVSQKGARG